ncbi:MAG TPA: hypothetical protein VFQ95_10065 [Rhodanobacteraceae bacterium]|nr:hypothetical protein [Rhodanobacteraceae bacterium]
MRTLPLTTQDRKPGGNQYLRRMVARITRMSRTARLRRQFAEIEQRSLELPRSYRTQLADLVQRECAAVESSDDPEAYGAHADHGASASGLDVGFDRARSDNVQVRMRGLALWLALVYHQTRGAAAPDVEALHRQVLRVMRELKVFSSRAPAEGGGD